jgi:hypothetical protein
MRLESGFLKQRQPPENRLARGGRIMKTTSPERLVPEIFASADVEVNGSRPWDIRVHHHLFYKRLAAGGSMALGESYMDGWWDCEALDQFFDRILRFRLDRSGKKIIENPLVCRQSGMHLLTGPFSGLCHRPPPLRHRQRPVFADAG